MNMGKEIIKVEQLIKNMGKEIIKVEQLHSTWKQTGYEYTIWTVISDEGFFKNTFVVDMPSDSNDHKLPTNERIESYITELWLAGRIDDIRKIIYRKGDLGWDDIMRIYRKEKLSNLVGQ